MSERDLRASLQSIGPQIAGLEYEGELVDGRKKARMCAEMGVAFPIQRAHSLEEACSILWTRHELRALELAGPIARSVLELARLCSTTPVSVAKVLHANKPKISHKAKMRAIEDQPYRQLKERPKMVKRLFTLEPELYAYAREAAAQLGHRNVNRLVRDALWEKVARVVPMAPQFQPRRVELAGPGAPNERDDHGRYRSPTKRRMG
jgi:hypothetical protein